MQRTIPRILKATGLVAVLWIASLLSSLLPARAQQPIGQPAPTGREGSEKREPTDPAKVLEKLNEEVRQLKTQVKELRDQNWVFMNHWTYALELEGPKEDYAQARLRFRTKLLRKGPSPQGWAALKPPAGVTEIEYPSGELRLKAWMNRPADETRKYPAVLFLHGGFAYGMGDWEQTKPYRDAGFVVLTPMLRGENGQPGAFSYYYDEVDDVLAAGEYLSRQPYVDVSRLFVAGHSVGGTMTLLAAIASDRFRAAASLDGAPYWPPFTDAIDLPFDKSNPLEIQMRSPMAYASSFKCPIRIYHHGKEGDRIAEVFALMSRRTVALAKQRGLDVDEIEIEGDHM